MPSLKTFKTKVKLSKAKKQNGHIPMFVRQMSSNNIRYNYKRRNWRRTKLNL